MNNNYSNSLLSLLKLKFSAKFHLLLLFLFVCSFANAATITSATSGNWNATTTWVGGVVPTASDDVIIATTHTVTVTVSTGITNLLLNKSSAKIIINPNQILTVSGTYKSNATLTDGVNGPGSIRFTGTISINRMTSTGTLPNVIIGDGVSTNTVKMASGFKVANLTINTGAIFDNNKKNIGIDGDLVVNGTLSSLIKGNFTFGGTNKTIGGSTPAITIYNAVFTGTYANNITVVNVVNALSGKGSLTNSAAKTLTIGNIVDNNTLSTLTATAAGNTVIYTRSAAQTVKPTTYYNLTLSGSGIKTLTSVVVNGTLSMQGTTQVSVAPTYGTAAKLEYNRTSAQVAGLEWLPTFTATGGVSIINTGLITSNSAKVFNSSVPLTVANDSGGGLDNGGFAISGASVFTLANDANLYLSGTSTFPSGFSTNTIGATSTVEYNGTAQTVAVQNYGNLNLSNSGNKTFAGATLIADELALSGTAVAILPTGSTSFSQTLTFSGVLQASTSWGGTAATTATNNSAVWFGITTTGILNVSLACTIGTWLGQSSTDWNNPNNWCSLIIPAASTNVVIPAAAPYKPIISTAGGSCRNISIASGSSLTIDPSSTLTVSGNWVNNGTLYANGTTAFNGTVLQTISGTGSNVFNNLTNSKTTFPLNAARDIIVNGVLDNVNVTSILDMGSNLLSGSFSNSGLGQIKTANTTATPIPSGKTWINTVVYNATTGGQSVVTGTYASLSLDNASGTQTALGNLTINNKLNIANGSPTFKMNGHDLSVGDFNITTSDAIIDMAGGSLSYTAITSMDGTISFSGATNGKAIPAGTVEYYGATQTVGPGTYNDITFTGTGGYSVNSDVVVNNELLITKGELTVQDGVSVTVSDIIKVDTPGTFILENNASLVQINDVTNVGRITYKRNTTPMNNFDYTYWSSPVSGQTLYNLSPNTLSDKYHSFTDPDWIDELGSNPMIAGKGYAIRTPKAGTWPNGEVVSFPYTQKVKFIGVPNNGDYTYIGISNNKSYLLGNPYPSAIDADAFLNENHLILDGTIYFWTHNTGIAPSGAFYVYNDNDYASYNLTGGTGTTAAATSISGVNFSVPSGKIAAGQSFFATGKGTGNVLFTNDMRVSGGVAGANNSQFFRTTKTKSKTSTAIEKNRVWLNLYNNEGAFKQTLVGYLAGATNGYDNRYDGESFDEHEFVDFYSVTPDKYLVIQGRALPFDETDTVPLGYRSKEEMNLNISIDQTDGVLATQNIYIEDKLLNVIHNIKDTPYAFTTEAGTFDNRFVLRYTDKTLGNTDFEGVNSSVVISKDKNELKIKSEIETIKRITVYDLLGKKVFEKEAVNSTEFRSSAIGFSQQIGIVKVTLDNGQVISKKVIF